MSKKFYVDLLGICSKKSSIKMRHIRVFGQKDLTFRTVIFHIFSDKIFQPRLKDGFDSLIKTMKKKRDDMIVSLPFDFCNWLTNPLDLNIMA